MLCSGTPAVTSSVTKQVFMSWILNLVFWEKTNCTRTEIELRSLNVLLERCPQCTTHLAAPCCFYFLIVLMHVVTKVQTLSKNVTFGTLPRVLKSIQPWHLRFLEPSVKHSIYICKESSTQVTIMCRVWHLQLWCEENRPLLCAACWVITLILEELLQHAEAVLNIQQAHENRALVFPCWLVFSRLHMPRRCRQGREGKISAQSG